MTADKRVAEIDRRVVDAKLRLLREYLSDLAEYESISAADYCGSKKDQRFVERTLHLACEACIDTAAHIISRLGMEPARNNRDLFRILAELQVISPPVHEAMTKMVRFRNIIVHDYTRIDPDIVVAILRNNLKDFKAFGADIIRFVENRPET